MPSIAVQRGKVVMRDGKVGSGQECCCGIPNEQPICDDSCVGPCVAVLNDLQQVGDHEKQSYLQDPNQAFAGEPPYVDGWLQDNINCVFVWVTDTVTQTGNAREPCGAGFAIRTWVRYRLFFFDCEAQQLQDVTGQALTREYGFTVCQFPGFPFPFCAPPYCNNNPNPGFLNTPPTLVCA